jgi:alpha-D-ribose 1-methylphosphonate 5-triphosphate diphosphatase
MIADFGTGRPPASAADVAGDFIMPGLIELHTDHIEAHYMPRPKVYWDPVAAVVSYDGQLAACGITTVLDSLRVWREEGADEVGGEAAVLAAAIAAARDADMLRIAHFLHLRCEVPMPDVVAEAAALIDRPEVRLVSLMDHTPGQRQFRDAEKLRTYYRSKAGGLTDAELDVLFDQRRDFAAHHATSNYRDLVALARRHGARLASHDDTTLEHVAQSVADRVAIARVSDHARGRARFTRGRDRRPHGGAQPGARKLPFRQCRDRGAGARRPVGRAVVGLHAGEPADGGVSSAPRGSLVRPAAGGRHRDPDAGGRRRPR